MRAPAAAWVTNTFGGRPKRARKAEVGLQISRGFALHQGDGRSAEAGTGHAGADESSFRAEVGGRLHEEVELGAADLEVVAQGFVTLTHDAGEPIPVAGAEGGDEGVHPLQFRDGMACPAEETVSELGPMRLQVVGGGVAE